jgi:DNA-binding MarR family transcriptional regulator
MSSDKQYQKRRRYLTFFSELSPQTDPEVIRLVGLMHRVAHALYQLSESSLEEANLSYSQYRLLMELHYQERFEGRPALNPSEISEHRGLSRNTVSSLISSLESDGLVIRELDAADRRRFLIKLTDAGRQVVKNHASRHFGAMQACFAELSLDEKKNMSALLERLADSPTLLTGQSSQRSQ